MTRRTAEPKIARAPILAGPATLADDRITLAEVTEQEAIESLKEWGLDYFLRIKEEFDKPAILKELDADSVDGLKLAELGFRKSQRED